MGNSCEMDTCIALQIIEGHRWLYFQNLATNVYQYLALFCFFFAHISQSTMWFQYVFSLFGVANVHCNFFTRLDSANF